MPYKDHVMLSVKGAYENGVVRLEQSLPDKQPCKVIVTFLEEEVEGGQDQ